MGLLLLLGVGALVWAWSTGRLSWPAARPLGTIALALAGGLALAHGSMVVGGLLIGGAVASAGWRKLVPGRSATPGADDSRLRESLDLLGLAPGADRAAVVEAHRRLIGRTHPDTGGTEALARAINGARDYLLLHLPH